MKKISQVAFLLLLLLYLFLDQASAYPSKAGHCNEGPINAQDVTNPHATYPSSLYGGDLAQGGYKITFDDVDLDNLNTNNIVAGQSYSVRIESTDTNSPTEFKGFLVRLRGDPSTKDSFTSSASNVQLHPDCKDNAAVTHVNNTPKISVGFDFSLSESIPSIELDATIVRSSSHGDWFYSSYTLSTSPTVDSPTLVPSSSPSQSPVESQPVLSQVPSPGPGDVYSCGTIDELVEIPGGKFFRLI